MEMNKTQRIYKVIMLIIITALITFLVTTIVLFNKFKTIYSTCSNESCGTNTLTGSTTQTSLNKTLEEFKAILEQKYMGQVNEQDLIDGAIKGYVEGLKDPYTEYLTKDEMQDLTDETNSKYVGIGVYVANDTKTDTILVAGVMNGSPALSAGMQAGDIIEKVDGVTYKGSQLQEATSILKGEENTDVNVTVLRNGKEIDMKITRKTITVEHVASNILDNNIGYTQINSFDEGVAEDFEAQVKNMQSSGIKGLIIDLRGNGGGIVSEATDIADLFTKKGDTLLITTDKNGNEEITKAQKDQTIKDIPVIVLVNEGTASASEILAGTLRDDYGAKIVGEKTYGKGVIQTVYKLSDGSGLKITTNEYYTPKRTKINKVGITPDEVVEPSKDANGAYNTTATEDAQLQKAISMIK